LSESAVVAKFGKALPHDETSGQPTAAAYEDLVAAVETGGAATPYSAIPQAYEATPKTAVPDDIDLNEDVLDDDTLDSKPLAQPETAWTYQASGGSTAQLRIAVPPTFDSDEAGAEMVELYWRALTRDVPFREYADNERIAAAAAELNELDGYAGPGADSEVTPANVFRGVTPGATTGPYISQFLWKDRVLGRGIEDQKIEPQASTTTPADYMTSVRDWQKVQNGVVPPLDENLPGNEYSDKRRYIITGRDMCERVHDDPPFRQVQKAAQVLIFTMDAPLDEGIPYTLKPFNKAGRSRRTVSKFTAQTTLPFNDFGPLYIEKKVLEATEQGQKAAWHKKWNVHRRLRPEEYGGRVQAVKSGANNGIDPSGGDTGNGNSGTGNGKGNRGNGNDNRNTDTTAHRPASTVSEPDLSPAGYSQAEIPENLLASRALERTKEEYGTYLLPQAYAEGSPTHPSYPAGHSVVAGAGVTVLKALFDGEYEFPPEQKVVPTPDGSALRTAAETDAHGISASLTVRGELNKLASNMALGRNRAGIHYRSDGIEGLRLGEAAAIRYLEDQLSLPDRVPGAGDLTLTLETFDGETITIEPSVDPTGTMR
jgi:hypothetical protein